jgi:hypothetical protein
VELEDAIDELYAAPLDEFTGERARLVKVLKEAGRKDEAGELAKLRKPSVAAWALNQLSRGNRREVDLLLDAGHRLREAQAHVLQGEGREAFERARADEAKAVAGLGREAEKLLRTRGGASAAVLNQVGESLRAAAISPDGRELLAKGRFTQPISHQGFDLVSELAGPPRRAARPKRDEEAKRRQEAVREARARLRSAEHDAREARQKAERALARAEAASREADEADATKDAAAAALAEAESAVNRR